MNRQDYLTRMEIQVETLDIWLERAWLVPAKEAADPEFSEVELARGRLIQDLKGGFGVNDEGVDVILHLLDQLHGFRRAFEDLQARLKAESGRSG